MGRKATNNRAKLPKNYEAALAALGVTKTPAEIELMVSASQVLNTIEAEKERWLRRIIVDTAKDAFASDALSVEDREMIEVNLKEFKDCFDALSAGKSEHTRKAASLGALKSAIFLFALAPPDREELRKREQHRTRPARDARAEKARSSNEKIAAAFRQVAEDTGFELKAGEKHIDIYFRKLVAAKLNIRIDELPPNGSLAKIVGKIKRGKL